MPSVAKEIGFADEHFSAVFGDIDELVHTGWMQRWLNSILNTPLVYLDYYDELSNGVINRFGVIDKIVEDAQATKKAYLVLLINHKNKVDENLEWAQSISSSPGEIEINIEPWDIESVVTPELESALQKSRVVVLHVLGKASSVGYGCLDLVMHV